MLNPWANQCSRCSAWRLSKRVDLTKYQRVHLCKLCIAGNGPLIEPVSTRKETKAQKRWRLDQVDEVLATLHDIRLTALASRAERKNRDNRTVLTAALEALGIPGYLQVRSLRPGAEGRIINFVNPVEEAA